MAQNISFLGAQYADVPAVTLPKTGGGTARFDDTSDADATASDIAQGKTAYVGGAKITGTASGGGGATIEPLSVTENGTYTAPSGVGYSPVTVSVAGGGGEWWDTPDPTDGKTHLWIEIPEDSPSNRLTYYVRFKQSVTRGVEVDWGDGSEPETFTGTSTSDRSHVYAQGGHYEITLKVTSGTITFEGTSSYSIFGTTSAYGRSRYTTIKRVYFGNGVNNAGIGAYALYYCCALEKITLPANLTSIGNYAFSSCYMLKNISFPSGVSSIGTYAFQNCYSVKLDIPNTISAIGNYTFSNCYRFLIVTVPNTVSSIGNSAFANCSGVSEYHIKPTTPPTLGTSVFSNISADCKIYVPYSADHSILEAYKAATNWSAFANKMVEEDAA